ncbi:uncharacterized protein LOC126380637 isoform X2 [Pectinophora gossypiella]|uniref:Set2 Rpb1 interacting domain-containing protein n=2 Tax=Pectinophora gossypiella TaxID=13191 RepID=A0A1E1W8H0_PECGO|nr:uncharacterized protein LOC126380637 isoform X2 [Pectinophora gossypiella]XP_049886143.1 uncharacterized protein LOC126380637 isoform X2 [Pectinophora gossypiella]
MEYLIKLLSVNYETNQKLHKNIYLPSAIWRCAKNIETTAAQTCMVVQLYRKYITSAIKELKNDTKKGKLNKNLYDYLHSPPQNEKKIQTDFSAIDKCSCECNCHLHRKRRKTSQFSEVLEVMQTDTPKIVKNDELPITVCNEVNKIPVLINSQIEPPQIIQNAVDTANNQKELNTNQSSPSKRSVRMSVELQESDELMLQLEKLFHSDPNDDDLYDTALCSTENIIATEDIIKTAQNDNADTAIPNVNPSIIESHSIQIKSLDERLASLTGLLTNNAETVTGQAKVDVPKTKKSSSSKWLCEEYFLKQRFHEMLDEMGDANRKKLARVKEILLVLFGEDDDNDAIVSPFEVTPELTISCKERIAPWVVKLLTPYYMKGRIRGKTLFKALAKHLIRLIYQCSRYPQHYEVQSFVSDFLKNHKLIRCEADFKQFRIENI